MSDERKPVVTTDNVGALTQFVRTVRLVWRLLNDSRVPGLTKLIIPAGLAYLLWPIDLLPDLILGLGQLDDLGVLALAVTMFIEFCPPAVVEEHRRAIARDAGSRTPADENTIEGTYREVRDDDSK